MVQVQIVYNNESTKLCDTDTLRFYEPGPWVSGSITIRLGPKDDEYQVPVINLHKLEFPGNTRIQVEFIDQSKMPFEVDYLEFSHNGDIIDCHEPTLGNYHLNTNLIREITFPNQPLPIPTHQLPLLTEMKQLYQEIMGWNMPEPWVQILTTITTVMMTQGPLTKPMKDLWITMFKLGLKLGKAMPPPGAVLNPQHLMAWVQHIRDVLNEVFPPKEAGQ